MDTEKPPGQPSPLEYLLRVESGDDIVELLVDTYVLSKTNFQVSSLNQVPQSFKTFKSLTKISEKNLKEFLHQMVQVIKNYQREDETALLSIFGEVSEESQAILLKCLKKMKMKINRDGVFNAGDKLLDINWNIEKEVFSSENGAKEELIVNMDICHQTLASGSVENMEFSMGRDEFKRFYESLTKLRDFSMTLLQQNSG
jgi:hypothetical protein